jgi:hypothetical protein
MAIFKELMQKNSEENDWNQLNGGLAITISSSNC